MNDESIRNIRLRLEEIRKLMADIRDSHNNVPEKYADNSMAAALGYSQGYAMGADIAASLAMNELVSLERRLKSATAEAV